jgi:hypothetical protein
LRRYRAEGRTPKQLAQNARLKVFETVNARTKAETHRQLYVRKDGQPIKGSGFWSLLGALYLQMEDLIAAPPEAVQAACGATVSSTCASMSRHSLTLPKVLAASIVPTVTASSARRRMGPPMLARTLITMLDAKPRIRPLDAL